MSKFDLSIIVPARNEEWLLPTINDVLANTSDRTEIICVLDGAWPVEPIPDHPRVTLIHHSESIGQRAAINEAARYSKAKYICKLDAHCRVDKDFDLKMMADCEYDWTVVPRLYNLHVFDWVCQSCQNRTYQGPKPKKCQMCQSSEVEREVVWKPRWHRRTDFMRFDNHLKFQYWPQFEKRPEGQGDLCETMSLLGACFFMHRERYWELGGSDESFGSWGQQGTEISLKTWLSGGRLMVNKKTWYSHLFRTQPGFGFPYPNTTAEQARRRSDELWLTDSWPLANRKLQWVIDHFAPIPDWHHEPAQTAGVVYYTENRCPEPIFSTVQKQILKSINGHSLISVSLKPIDFGANITLGLERGILTMFQQILAGLSDSNADYVFLTEHDCLYPKEHFDFVPPRKDTFYYNLNVYKVDSVTGQAVTYETKQTSGLVANRQLLIDHYRRRIDRVIAEGKYDRRIGFEPGGHQFPRGIDNVRSETFRSAKPIVDIRHTSNLTASRWRQEDFRSQKACQGWQLVDEIPGWSGKTLGRFNEWLAEVVQ